MALLRQLADQVKIPSGSVNIPKVDASDATFSKIVGGIFVVIGAFSVLYLILGALRYVNSDGQQGKIEQAKNSILYAVIGILVSVFAFAIVQFILGRIVQG
jgi:uncharacterized membrane protein YidH (DUF202 family)